ncbi:hypothetical protein D477_003008 [Arthrobacter crystallopoietes BAB-32]|uniref:Uncharacterized protein n=1 Tax=Arthrobacter crystallopoietes BAB-32 TaxID=1246476 RepID=N1V2Q6_9MICC|nr:hypothetical protein [Arthrobacter crystallopoietes]EMY35630.1 hypothetical protein D477_003008 [Arthrobacter crystallopoietes BAB-32]
MGMHVLLDLAQPVTLQDLKDFVRRGEDCVDDPEGDIRWQVAEDGTPNCLLLELPSSQSRLERVTKGASPALSISYVNPLAEAAASESIGASADAAPAHGG